MICSRGCPSCHVSLGAAQPSVSPGRVLSRFSTLCTPMTEARRLPGAGDIRFARHRTGQNDHVAECDDVYVACVDEARVAKKAQDLLCQIIIGQMRVVVLVRIGRMLARHSFIPVLKRNAL
ncbi:hypothetical protein ABIA13_003673 [Sinorhizobium fredii]